MTIILAILLGVLFGFALNRVGATNPENIINMIRLKDLSLMKTIMFAVGFASLCLFGGMAIGLIDSGHLSVKATHWGVAIGGALLGIGFAIAGYCPGTGLCAAATGRRDALVFILGGLVGAFIYTLHYGSVKATGLLDNLWGGKVTLANTGNADYVTLIQGIDGWIVASSLAILFIVIAYFLPRSFCNKD